MERETLILIVLTVLVFAATACGDPDEDNTGSWPEGRRQGLYENCSMDAPADYCACILDAMTTAYPYEDCKGHVGKCWQETEASYSETCR